jgi:GT2 family glycosyltransferase
VAAWSEPWRRALQAAAGLTGESLDAVLPARLLDATPFNLAGPDDRLGFFDLEWQPAWPVEYGFVLFRGLFWSLARLRSVATGAVATPITVQAVTLDVLRTAGLPVTDTDAERYLDLEAALQEQTAAVAAPAARAAIAAMTLLPRTPLHELSLAADLGAQKTKIDAYTRQVERQYAELEAHARNLDRERDRLEGELRDTVTQRDELRERATRLEDARARAALHLAQAEAAHRGTADELRAMTRDRDRLASDLTIVRRREDEVAALLRARERTLRLERRALERTRVETTLAEQQMRQLAAAPPHPRSADEASVLGRIRRRLRGAEVPLGMTIRHPARFARGLVRLRHQGYRALVAQLAESGLFDREHYRRANGAAPHVNLVARFLLGGDLAGESSHPLFDPAWYRARYPDLGSTMPPLRHYLSAGGWELRAPHPLFDPAHYLAQWPAERVRAVTPLSHYVQVGARAAASPHPLFDARHYLRQRPDLAEAGVDPLAHYLAHGATEGLDPHPLFSTRHYQARYPEVGSGNPLLHYVERGAADGCSPHPLFDTAYYWEQRPDVRDHGGNALVHFLEFGGFEGVPPHPLFDTAFYLEQAEGLRALGINPLVHFLRWGWEDGAWPNRYFDPQWYLAENPDLSDVNPLLHFMAHGWREHRAPSPAFSVAGYLAANPDIAQAGVNPLEHFLRYGSNEGRRAVPVVRAPSSPAISDADALDRLASCVPAQVEFRVVVPWSAGCARAAEDTLASLHAQRYPRWRMVVVAEASAITEVPAPMRADTRVHIAADARAAVALPPDTATAGDAFVGWLQPGDVLEPHALLLAAHAIDDDPALELVYADEATRGPTGPIAPIHKPDWDPLLQTTVDVAGPGTWLRASRAAALLETLDAGVSATPGALHHAAAMHVARERARRLPFVLVHTAAAHAYAARLTAARPVSLDRLDGLAQRLYGMPGRTTADLPMVSILVPTRNRADLLATCVTSVLEVTRYPHFELIVIDNGSDEADSLALLDELGRNPRCRVLANPGPFNYSALNNSAAELATGELLCLMNNDIEVRDPEWLRALVTVARQPRAGAVGATLYYPDGTRQHAGMVLGVHGVAGHAFVGSSVDEPTYMGLAGLPREVSAVTGACLLVAASKFFEVGGLDAASLPINFNDIDFCLRLRQRGYGNVVLPLVGIIHHESASRGRVGQSPERLAQLGREAQTMLHRWGDALRHDPYYNPNLSLTAPYESVTPSRVRLPHGRTGAATATPFTALGREARLDIYAESTNDQRVGEALASQQAETPVHGLPAGLTVVILNKNSPELLTPLVRQLEAQLGAFAAAGVGCEVIVGDTGSSNPAILALYQAMPHGMRVVRDLRYNFSRCNNQLEALATFDTVLFLNNDIILPEAGDELLRAYTVLSSRPSLGVLGAVMRYPDGTIQHMGCGLLRDPGYWGLPYHAHARTRIASEEIAALADYPAVTGAFLMINRALFRACGGFDEGYAAECQDTALCLDARRLGYEVACANVGTIIHIENGTRPKGEEHWPDRQRFLRKYGAYIQAVWP